jgi:hypothetical protein
MDAFAGQALAKFFECDVGLFRDGGHDEIPMRLDAVRALIAAHRLGLRIALVALKSAPPHRAGGADAKAFRRLPARKAVSYCRHDTFSEIKRKRFAHACRPPSPARSLNLTRASLGIPYDSECSESALEFT